MKYLLFNPLANNFKAKDTISEIEKLHSNYDYNKLDITKINFDDFFTNLKENDTITILGGDGTLSIFASAYQKYKPTNSIYLYQGGSGNDFMNDINVNSKEVLINKYLVHLPHVIVNDKEYYFINGIGYGIDGAVCEEADILKEKGAKKINYTMIALKLLLGKFKTYNAKITVDGVSSEFKHVWLAAGMNGRFYGGGMMVAPNQDRFSGQLSLVTMFSKSRLKALISFRLIFSGKLAQKEKMVKSFKGKRIEVQFDRPCALQIDGEVIKNVTKYVAYYD